MPDMACAFPNDDGITVVAVLPDEKRLPDFRKDPEGSFLDLVRALPDAPPVDSAEHATKITGTADRPRTPAHPHTRTPAHPQADGTGARPGAVGVMNPRGRRGTGHRRRRGPPRPCPRS
ncbi:hypothetical protein GCM10010275_34280 [Streptomyces litmocidini]|nr:hypothetical protein GCM10010275_34280 [Streptomyces litmocidini]